MEAIVIQPGQWGFITPIIPPLESFTVSPGKFGFGYSCTCTSTGEIGYFGVGGYLSTWPKCPK